MISWIFSPGRTPVTTTPMGRSPMSAAATGARWGGPAVGRRGAVVHLGARDARHEELPALGVAHGREDGVDGAVEREEEARHLRGGDRDRAAARGLLEEQRHD